MAHFMVKGKKENEIASDIMPYALSNTIVAVLVALILGGGAFYLNAGTRFGELEKESAYLKAEIQEDRKRLEKIEQKLDIINTTLYNFKMDIIDELRKLER